MVFIGSVMAVFLTNPKKCAYEICGPREWMTTDGGWMVLGSCASCPEYERAAQDFRSCRPDDCT